MSEIQNAICIMNVLAEMLNALDLGNREVAKVFEAKQLKMVPNSQEWLITTILFRAGICRQLPFYFCSWHVSTVISRGDDPVTKRTVQRTACAHNLCVASSYRAVAT